MTQADKKFLVLSKQYDTKSQVFGYSRKESKSSFCDPKVSKQTFESRVAPANAQIATNTQSVYSHNISDKLKYLQIKDILDEDLVGDILSPQPDPLDIY
jgi:hypothetical protein